MINTATAVPTLHVLKIDWFSQKINTIRTAGKNFRLYPSAKKHPALLGGAS
jgi:hypothetical protein